MSHPWVTFLPTELQAVRMIIPILKMRKWSSQRSNDLLKAVSIVRDKLPVSKGNPHSIVPQLLLFNCSVDIISLHILLWKMHSNKEILWNPTFNKSLQKRDEGNLLSQVSLKTGRNKAKARWDARRIFYDYLSLRIDRTQRWFCLSPFRFPDRASNP